MNDINTLMNKLDLVLDYKNNIKQAITNKGQDATDDLSTYSNLISNIVDYTGTIDPAEYQDCLNLTQNILGISNQ